ncbi:hypothetical protein [Maribacter aestuarii]|uniref:hypothetical protein n=1 Tax=Maribacter aestuarii TaxID=1130723 RepID=UPI00248BAD80|nr:hypothetical protein [Maribacter aestuarii]
MKHKINIQFFLVLLLGLWMLQGQAQTLHEVVLTVDAIKPNSEANLSFSAGSTTTVIEKATGKRFAIWADVGDSVLWKAKAAGESQVPVHVVGVNYRSGPRIFSSNTLTGKSTVKATIIRGGKEDYVYELQYSLGSDTKLYQVTAVIKTKK